MFLFAIIGSSPPKYKQAIVSENILQQIGEDDPDAFKEFYEITQKTLYSYILSIVTNQHDAEDILQETYLKIRAAAHLYEPQGKPMAWVFTIAKNLSYMHLRRQKKILDTGIDEMENHSIFSNRLVQEDKILLETVLLELEEIERSIILLHAVSGFKHREISKNLCIPLPTVLSKYYRGLKKLKKSISHSIRGKHEQ
jgi:RNA polymerase sigma-70 factor (ECF subfamily)